MTRLNKIELALLILASKAGTVFARANGGSGLASTYRHNKPRGKSGKKGSQPRSNASAPRIGGVIQLPN
jgi:hypothetical protein